MSGTTPFDQAKALINQATAGITACLGQTNTMKAIPSTYHSLIAGIRDDARAAVIGTDDDIRTLMAVKRFHETFRARVQRLIDLAVEGKGGPNIPGEPIKPSSESARVISHINAYKRAAELVGAW